jgi:hypothetical protein
MNVVTLETLLSIHYTGTAKLVPRETEFTFSQIDAYKTLVREGLIEACQDAIAGRLWHHVDCQTTEKGKAFIETLKNTPMPVQAWVPAK